MNIIEFFIAQVLSSPNKVAIVDNGKTITYSQLLKQIKETANYFKSKEIGKGDKVLIAVPISIDTYRIVLALFYIGAIPVFMEEWAFKNNLHNNIKQLDCKAVVVAKKFSILAFLSKGIRSIPIKLSTSKLGNKNIELCQLLDNDPALFSFTSGSSGTSKITIRSHDFLREQFRVLSEVTNCKGTETVCCGLAVVVLFYLGQGNTVVLRTKKMLGKPKLLSTYLAKFKVSQIIDSPAKLLAYTNSLTTSTKENITHIFTGGGPVFPNDATQLNSNFKNSISTIIYGSTEVEPISTITSDAIIETNKNGDDGLCVGQPNKNLSLKIIKVNTTERVFSTLSEFNTICLADNEIGEVVVMGKHVLDTYYNSEAIFKQQKIEVGTDLWHKTGDSGYVKNRLLYLTGPCNALVEIDSKLNSPFIFENKVRQISDITAGTFIQLKNKLIVIIESTQTTELLTVEIEKIINLDHLIILKKIPMDARHHTKINYIELKKIVNNRLNSNNLT